MCMYVCCVQYVFACVCVCMCVCVCVCVCACVCVHAGVCVRVCKDSLVITVMCAFGQCGCSVVIVYIREVECSITTVYKRLIAV